MVAALAMMDTESLCGKRGGSMRLPGRSGFAAVVGLLLWLLATPGLAGLSAQYGFDDPHLDDLLSRCGRPLDAYAQVLAATNPPEVVDFSIRDLLSTLRGSAQWSPAQIAEREALNASASIQDPAGAAAAEVARCILAEELVIRRKRPPG